MQTNAIRALLGAPGLSGSAVPMPATMSWATDIPMAPNISSGRLPQRSTKNNPGTVLQMFTTHVMTETVKGLEIPAEVKYVVPGF